jgi:hypothetical protein
LQHNHSIKTTKEDPMSRVVRPEIDAAGFETNLDECSAPLKELVEYLRFQIATMPEAVRFVKWILWAHDKRP